MIVKINKLQNYNYVYFINLIITARKSIMKKRNDTSDSSIRNFNYIKKEIILPWLKDQ